MGVLRTPILKAIRKRVRHVERDAVEAMIANAILFFTLMVWMVALYRLMAFYRMTMMGRRNYDEW